jgi:hypothetical protein
MTIQASSGGSRFSSSIYANRLPVQINDEIGRHQVGGDPAADQLSGGGTLSQMVLWRACLVGSGGGYVDRVLPGSKLACMVRRKFVPAFRVGRDQALCLRRVAFLRANDASARHQQHPYTPRSRPHRCTSGYVHDKAGKSIRAAEGRYLSTGREVEGSRSVFCAGACSRGSVRAVRSRAARRSSSPGVLPATSPRRRLASRWIADGRPVRWAGGRRPASSPGS